MTDYEFNDKAMQNLISEDERIDLENATNEFRKELGTMDLQKYMNNIFAEGTLDKIDEDTEIEFTDDDKKELRKIQTGEAGVLSISCKVAVKLLKKYRKSIVAKLKKIPKVGPKLGGWFDKKFGSIVKFLETAKGGAQSALKKIFKKLGLSNENADILADAVLTILSLFI